jgi:hypothetical protein
MMTSLRPNNLASTEYAPGPMNKMLRSMVAAKSTVNPESKMGGRQLARPASPIAPAPNATRIAATGVKKPISNRPLARHSAKPTNVTAAFRLGSRKQDRACNSGLTLKTIRSNSSAVPGYPPGNDEKRRCSFPPVDQTDQPSRCFGSEPADDPYLPAGRRRRTGSAGDSPDHFGMRQ